MTSYDISPSVNVFRLHNCDIMGNLDGSDLNQGHEHPIKHAMISAYDLETMRSCPEITKNGSMHSFTTQWSTVTTQTSNTTKRQCEKKYRKKKFLNFVKILMRIVKEKDKRRFRNAKAVICNCEEQKKRGEIDSLSESLRCPLKDAVGPQLWKEAQDRMSAAPLYMKVKESSIGTTVESEIESPSNTSSSFIRHRAESSAQSPATITPKPAKSNDATTATITNVALRKKRLWMVIRVFMQFLRNDHCKLYSKAHALVNECVRRHKRIKHFEKSNSLSGSIQACLKKEFGLEHWRRAEQHVLEILPVCNEDRQSGESKHNRYSKENIDRSSIESVEDDA